MYLLEKSIRRYRGNVTPRYEKRRGYPKISAGKITFPIPVCEESITSRSIKRADIYVKSKEFKISYEVFYGKKSLKCNILSCQT